MFIAVRDLLLKHVPAGPFASLQRLDARSVDIVLGRDMSTPHFAAQRGEPYDFGQPGDRASLVNRLQETGMDVCCLSLSTRFAEPDLDEQIEWMAAAAEAARDVDAPTVRIDPWFEPRLTAKDKFLERMAAAVQSVLARTKETDFAAENHGPVANQPEFLHALLERVGSERFGLALDPGNFYWAGEPLERVFELVQGFAPFAKHVHAKNIAYPEERRNVRREVGWEYGTYVCPLPDGDIDWKRIVRLLREEGYERALAVEDESLGEASEPNVLNVLMSDVEYLQTILR